LTARELALKDMIAAASINSGTMGSGITGERHTDVVSALPLGRLGRVGEVVVSTPFLARPEPGLITGTKYNLNG
jgi:NAD(P)-dependent dehydrogenase (short-subunit alcohol dehydrogenase family)